MPLAANRSAWVGSGRTCVPRRDHHLLPLVDGHIALGEADAGGQVVWPAESAVNIYEQHALHITACVDQAASLPPMNVFHDQA